MKTKLFSTCAALLLSLSAATMLSSCQKEEALVVQKSDNSFVSYTADQYGGVTDWSEKTAYYQFEGYKDESANVPTTGIPKMEFNVLANLYTDGSLRIYQYSVEGFNLTYYGYWYNETETQELAIKIQAVAIFYKGKTLAPSADCDQLVSYVSLTDGTDKEGYDYECILPLTYFASYSGNMGLNFDMYGIRGVLVSDEDAWFTEHKTGEYVATSSDGGSN